MALDRDALADAIKAAMDTANKQAWKPAQFADALADAIHDYTRAAEVAGVHGTAGGSDFAQSGTGVLQ